MKLYINKGNILKINDKDYLEIINLDEFVNFIKENSKTIPAGHIVVTLHYKVKVNNEEYLGNSKFDSYNGFSDLLDDNCPYIIKLENWALVEDNPYIEFSIKSK